MSTIEQKMNIEIETAKPKRLAPEQRRNQSNSNSNSSSSNSNSNSQNYHHSNSNSSSNTASRNTPKVDWEVQVTSWLKGFLPTINANSGNLNCNLCALALDNILSNGNPKEGVVPVSKETPMVYLDPKFGKEGQIVRSKSSNENWIARCTNSKFNFERYDLTNDQYKEPIIEIDFDDKPTKKIHLFPSDTEKLFDDLRNLPRRKGNQSWDNANTAHGFIVLTYRKNVMGGHIINFLVSPTGRVFLIDPQLNLIHENLSFAKKYRKEIYYYNSNPPEGFVIKQENAEDDIKVKQEIMQNPEKGEDIIASSSNSTNSSLNPANLFFSNTASSTNFSSKNSTDYFTSNSSNVDLMRPIKSTDTPNTDTEMVSASHEDNFSNDIEDNHSNNKHSNNKEQSIKINNLETNHRVRKWVEESSGMLNGEEWLENKLINEVVSLMRRPERVNSMFDIIVNYKLKVNKFYIKHSGTLISIARDQKLGSFAFERLCKIALEEISDKYKFSTDLNDLHTRAFLGDPSLFNQSFDNKEFLENSGPNGISVIEAIVIGKNDILFEKWVHNDHNNGRLINSILNRDLIDLIIKSESMMIFDHILKLMPHSNCYTKNNMDQIRLEILSSALHLNADFIIKLLKDKKLMGKFIFHNYENGDTSLMQAIKMHDMKLFEMLVEEEPKSCYDDYRYRSNSFGQYKFSSYNFSLLHATNCKGHSVLDIAIAGVNTQEFYKKIRAIAPSLVPYSSKQNNADNTHNRNNNSSNSNLNSSLNLTSNSNSPSNSSSNSNAGLNFHSNSSSHSNSASNSKSNSTDYFRTDSSNVDLMWPIKLTDTQHTDTEMVSVNDEDNFSSNFDDNHSNNKEKSIKINNDSIKIRNRGVANRIYKLVEESSGLLKGEEWLENKLINEVVSLMNRPETIDTLFEIIINCKLKVNKFYKKPPGTLISIARDNKLDSLAFERLCKIALEEISDKYKFSTDLNDLHTRAFLGDPTLFNQSVDNKIFLENSGPNGISVFEAVVIGKNDVLFKKLVFPNNIFQSGNEIHFVNSILSRRLIDLIIKSESMSIFDYIIKLIAKRWNRFEDIENEKKAQIQLGILSAAVHLNADYFIKLLKEEGLMGKFIFHNYENGDTSLMQAIKMHDMKLFEMLVEEERKPYYDDFRWKGTNSSEHYKFPSHNISLLYATNCDGHSVLDIAIAGVNTQEFCKKIRVIAPSLVPFSSKQNNADNTGNVNSNNSNFNLNFSFNSYSNSYSLSNSSSNSNAAFNFHSNSSFYSNSSDNSNFSLNFNPSFDFDGDDSNGNSSRKRGRSEENFSEIDTTQQEDEATLWLNSIDEPPNKKHKP